MNAPGADAEFRVTVRFPEPLRDSVGPSTEIRTPVRTLGELIDLLEARIPGFTEANDELYNFAVNGEMILHGERRREIRTGDEIEMIAAFSGG